MALDLLLIDASPAMRRMMHRTLRMGTLQVDHIHEAADAEETQHLLDEHWVDGIIASWQLWYSSQMRMVEWLTSNEVMHEIPLIVTTAEGQDSTLEEIDRCNPAGLLVKPFQPEKLYSKVKALELYETE